MGLLARFAGIEKVDLIRLLLMDRVTSDPVAIEAGFTAADVKKLADGQVLGAPEATIVTIAEDYLKLKDQKFSELDAINRIEQHRQSIGRGPGGPPSNIHSFIHYRMSIEHHGGEIPEPHIDMCIAAAERLFARKRDSDAVNAFELAKLQATALRHERIMRALSAYFSGDLDDDQFIDEVNEEVEAWQLANSVPSEPLPVFRFGSIQ